MVVGPLVSVVGVGTDLVELARVRKMLARKGDHAIRRLLTDAEREYVASRPDPTPHVAARLAAKEAVYKALQQLEGARAVGWREIEVLRAFDGRPSVELHGLARELAAGLRIHLSLSHTNRVATAVAILERTP